MSARESRSAAQHHVAQPVRVRAWVQVKAAPGPEEVNWPALWMNYKQR